MGEKRGLTLIPECWSQMRQNINPDRNLDKGHASVPTAIFFFLLFLIIFRLKLFPDKKIKQEFNRFEIRPMKLLLSAQTWTTSLLPTPLALNRVFFFLIITWNLVTQPLRVLGCERLYPVFSFACFITRSRPQCDAGTRHRVGGAGSAWSARALGVKPRPEVSARPRSSANSGELTFISVRPLFRLLSRRAAGGFSRSKTSG